MEKLILSVCVLLMTLVTVAVAEEKFETDTIKISAGDLKITFIGHGTLMFTFQGKIIHIDPFGEMADYTKLPKADVILLTHEHRDHLDPKVLGILRIEKTVILLTQTCAKQIEGGIVMNNGDLKTIEGLKIEAVPAYNIVHKREGTS
jgi:L-ascorbate metabolism protein UlaG (beta-lactamase superfamily)